MLSEVIASFSSDSNYSTRDLVCIRVCFRIDINYFIAFDKEFYKELTTFLSYFLKGFHSHKVMSLA